MNPPLRNEAADGAHALWNPRARLRDGLAPYGEGFREDLADALHAGWRGTAEAEALFGLAPVHGALLALVAVRDRKLVYARLVEPVLTECLPGSQGRLGRAALADHRTAVFRAARALERETEDGPGCLPAMRRLWRHGDAQGLSGRDCLADCLCRLAELAPEAPHRWGCDPRTPPAAARPD